MRLWIYELHKSGSELGVDHRATQQQKQRIRYIYLFLQTAVEIGECIQKFPDWVDNEIYAYNNEHSLRGNTKGYGGKTH